MTRLEKIDSIKSWYRAQVSGEIRLFKGEDNEMTTENIFCKLNHYSQLARLARKDKLRPEHIAQIERAYYFNNTCWPLERIANRAGETASEAA